MIARVHVSSILCVVFNEWYTINYYEHNNPKEPKMVLFLFDIFMGFPKFHETLKSIVSKARKFFNVFTYLFYFKVSIIYIWYSKCVCAGVCRSTLGLMSTAYKCSYILYRDEKKKGNKLLGSRFSVWAHTLNKRIT